MNINYWNLSNEELVVYAKSVIEKYEEQKNLSGSVYNGVSLADLQQLQSHLQRTIFTTNNGRTTHDKIREILKNDARIDSDEKKDMQVKSLWELEQDRMKFIRPL